MKQYWIPAEARDFALIPKGSSKLCWHLSFPFNVHRWLSVQTLKLITYLNLIPG